MSTATGDTRPNWRERLVALRYTPALLRLVWQTSPGLLGATVVLRLIRSVLPVGILWVAKLIIDAIVAARETQAGFGALQNLVLLEIALVVGAEFLSRASQLVDTVLSDLFGNHVSVRIMEHAATLDLAQLENPASNDLMERARRSATGRIGVLTHLLGVGEGSITLVAISTALLAFNPWLLLLLSLAVVPSFLGEVRFSAKQYNLIFQWTQQRRRLDYLRLLAASVDTAKEVKVFGLASWLTHQFRRLSHRWHTENRRLAVRRAVASSGLSLIATAGYYGAYVLIIIGTIAGSITLGSLTFLAMSFARGRETVQLLLSTLGSIYDESLYTRDLFAFLETKPTICSRPTARTVPYPMREGIVFEDVGFRYPGRDMWALRYASFHLRVGERIAIVGENGSGKTTLTRLLTRLYDPTEGRVLLDGIDLREYELASLRRAFSVMFQDYVRYDLRFNENIAVGSITDMRAYLESSQANGYAPAEMQTASEKSRAAQLLQKLPARWQQMLGKRFDEGIDLSVGEWQKVALARAYLRDANVFILDEPTASLDARAEYELFRGFSELIDGRSAVLVSHRFSTVRTADRILVLNGGAIVEQGTHNELVDSRGLYAELFAMQASSYR